MLDWVESRNSQFVPRYRGQLLCSSVDPVSEARKWIEKSVNRDEPFDVFFVLGLAGGFHVAYLAQIFPESEIIVIEQNQDLCDELQSRRGPLSHNVTIITGNNLKTLRENVYIRAGLKSLFKILKYPTSYRIHQKEFEEIESFMLGRSKQSLQTLVENRRAQKIFFESIKLFENLSDANLISIFDIEHAVRKRNTPLEHEGLLWMTLRELVK